MSKGVKAAVGQVRRVERSGAYYKNRKGKALVKWEKGKRVGVGPGIRSGAPTVKSPKEVARLSGRVHRVPTHLSKGKGGRGVSG